MRPRVLLVANTSWYLKNFRLPLAHRLRANGFDPVFLAPDQAQFEFLRALGFRCEAYPLRRGALAPWHALHTTLALARIYRRERPLLIHHFTITCVLLGGCAARLAGAPRVVGAITGLGHLFLAQNAKARFARTLALPTLQRIFRAKWHRVIFQNRDDLLRLLPGWHPGKLLGYVSEIPTSGVDIRYFRPGALSGSRNPKRILFVGRLLKEKGCRELIRALELLRERGVFFEASIVGSPDPGNPSSLKPEELAHWAAIPGVTMHGHLEDVREEMAKAALLVLPSYREGGSKVILEASAMALPIVTTDVPGCRNLVVEGETGSLVPAGESAPLARAIEWLLDHPAEALTRGENGRRFVEERFSDEVICSQTLSVYRSFPGVVFSPEVAEVES